MKQLFIMSCATALLAGCATVPPPAMSKSDAVARARIVYGTGVSTGRRLELPANSTGTGPHDFYNLFARMGTGSDAVYGIAIATGGKVSHQDAEVSIQGGGGLKVEGRQQISAGLGNKVDYIEAVFSRDFLERASAAGAGLQMKSSKGALEFTVPDWMFAALLEVADQNDWHRKFDREYRDREQARKQIRELYVKAHPELPQPRKDAVLKGSLVLGMSPEDARASWGEPEKINRTVSTRSVHEQWIYGSTYVYFDDGVLKSWQDSR